MLIRCSAVSSPLPGSICNRSMESTVSSLGKARAKRRCCSAKLIMKSPCGGTCSGSMLLSARIGQVRLVDQYAEIRQPTVPFHQSRRSEAIQCRLIERPDGITHTTAVIIDQNGGAVLLHDMMPAQMDVLDADRVERRHGVQWVKAMIALRAIEIVDIEQQATTSAPSQCSHEFAFADRRMPITEI